MRQAFSVYDNHRLSSFPAGYEAAMLRSKQDRGRYTESTLVFPNNNIQDITKLALESVQNVGVWVSNVDREISERRNENEVEGGRKVFKDAFYVTTGKKIKDRDYIIVQPTPDLNTPTEEEYNEAHEDYIHYISRLKFHAFQDHSLERQSDIDRFYIDVGLQIEVAGTTVLFDRGNLSHIIDNILRIDTARDLISSNAIVRDSVGLVKNFSGFRYKPSRPCGPLGVVFAQGYSTERVMTARKNGVKSGMTMHPKSVIMSYVKGYETVPYCLDIRKVIEAYDQVYDFPSRFEIRLPEENVTDVFWGLGEELIKNSFYVMDSVDWMYVLSFFLLLSYLTLFYSSYKMTVAHACHEHVNSILKAPFVQFTDNSTYLMSFAIAYRLNALTSAPEVGGTANYIWRHSFDSITDDSPASSRDTTTSMFFLRPFLFPNGFVPVFKRNMHLDEHIFTNLTQMSFSNARDAIKERNNTLTRPRVDRANKSRTTVVVFDEEVPIEENALTTDRVGEDNDLDICAAFMEGGGPTKCYPNESNVDELRRTFTFPSVAESLFVACIQQYFSDGLTKAPVRSKRSDPPYYLYTEDEIDLGVVLFQRSQVHSVFDAFNIKLCNEEQFSQNIAKAFPKEFVSPDQAKLQQNYNGMVYYRMWNNFVAYATSHGRRDLVHRYFNSIVEYFSTTCVWMPQHFPGRFWNTKQSDQPGFKDHLQFKYPSEACPRVCIVALNKHKDTFKGIYDDFEANNPGIDLRAQPTVGEQLLTQSRAMEDRVRFHRNRYPVFPTKDNPNYPVEHPNPLTEEAINEHMRIRDISIPLHSDLESLLTVSSCSDGVRSSDHYPSD